MKARFTDEQIIHCPAGDCAAICQDWGISSATFYKYKSKYGGMEPSDAKRLRGLEDENGKLKKLLPSSCRVSAWIDVAIALISKLEASLSTYWGALRQNHISSKNRWRFGTTGLISESHVG